MDVVAICLTADRQEMTSRAIRCFECQSYSDSSLIVYDTGREPFEYHGHDRRVVIMRTAAQRATIGELRNFANAAVRQPAKAQIFLHWDSDDVYSEDHIQHVVGQLVTAPGVGAVGYREACFFHRETQSAWLYTNPVESYAIGASLCYWGSCWDQRQFEPVDCGEDSRWLRGVRSRGLIGHNNFKPWMIAELHGANTSSHRAFERMNSENWARLHDHDAVFAELLRSA